MELYSDGQARGVVTKDEFHDVGPSMNSTIRVRGIYIHKFTCIYMPDNMYININNHIMQEAMGSSHSRTVIKRQIQIHK